MSKKNYVVDTNVFLTNPYSILQYGTNDIVIPLKVLEEIDKHKSRQDLIGFNARRIVKFIEELRKKGNLSNGIRIGKGKGLLFTMGYALEVLPKEFSIKNPDNEIIAVALTLKRDMPSRKTIMVTRDINMRVKCDSLELETEDYELESAIGKREELYTGFSTCLVDEQIIENFYAGKDIFLDDNETLYPNQFVMLMSNSNNKKTALARFMNYATPLKKMVEYKHGLFGIKSRNKEQVFSMELLMDPNVPVVTLMGTSGVGKTLIAIAAGLEQILESKIYKKMIVTRAVVPVGKDIGYLPGSLAEKMDPWLSPIKDNLENLLGDKKQFENFVEDGTIEIEALTYMRGRSIANAYIIIDEAQNLSLHEIKTIITRVGEGTKIILTGDVEQIDNSILNELTNGLSNTIEKFKDQEISGHITLIKGERSRVASIAAKIL